MKMMMRKFGAVALAALAFGAVCFTPAEAAYKPKITSKMGGQAVKDVQKVVAALKSMPKSVRWAFLAERLGLLFMPPNGAGGHHNDTGNMLNGSHFIGVDGMEYDACAECNARPKDPDTWVFSYGIVDRVGREVVFSKMSSEVTALVLQNAKYQLDKLAEEYPEARDAILARLAQLEYLPDGTSSYVLKTWKWGRTNVVNEYVLSNPNVYSFRYMDTEGKEQCTGNVYDRMNKGRWATLLICAHHVGRKDILALCPEEVKKLRANYKKKMQELGVSVTEPKKDKAEEETSKPSAKAESLAKKLGVTYRPKTNADRMSGQFKKDVQNVLKYLDSIPKPMRWFFFAERMGLFFMPANGEIGHEDNGWPRGGCHYIGVDGIEYDANSEWPTCPNGSEWGAYGWSADRLGREVVFSQLPEEIAEFVLQNAKYQLDKMAEEQPERRDLLLAYLAGLCYMPDGSSAYGTETTLMGPHKQPISYTPLDPHCKFIDTKGVEQDNDAVTQKYAALKGARWTILNVCAHHVGKDAILALCPKEVKKLRANYKKKMQELGVSVTEPKKDKAEEETSKPSAKAESLAKKLGVTYRPKTNADRMSGQFKKDLNSVVSYLKSLPKSQRWYFIAERMGLLFMPQDGSHGYTDGWSKTGSHFIGANGMEYDGRSEVDALPSGNPWVSISGLTDRLGRALVFSKFPDEVAELVLQNAKYQLDKLAAEKPEGRDAILTRIGQLEYLPDGTAPYARITWENPHGNIFYEYKIEAWQKCCFTDTEGKERFNKDVVGGIEGRWFILLICAHHLGADAILALCPEEVKKLRANREKRMQELKK